MTKPATEQEQGATEIPATDNSQHATVQLNVPIKRKGGDIGSLTLRKPKVTDLRDINLPSLVNSDTNSVIKLLPRISAPALIAREVEELDITDFIEVAGTIIGFFMNPAQRAMVAEMQARATP